MGRNLLNLICRNKLKLLPNSFPGVYQLYCTCNALYIGESKKKVVTRRFYWKVGKLRHKPQNKPWINPKSLRTVQQYHKRKIRETLEIKKAKTNKRRKVLNRDEGNLVKTDTLTPLFAKLTEKETNTKT